MSTINTLKDYLINNYLLNDAHNGKVIMLSGAWGSGKTYFWQETIAKEQTKIVVNKKSRTKYIDKEYQEGIEYKLQQKGKSYVYISLYGKDSIDALKSEILQKAYVAGVENENTPITKTISAFGIGTKILSSISIFGVKVDAQALNDEVQNHFDIEKIRKATDFLSDGGLICFDDFERKSTKIDLNDLFGFISQLAIDMKCKIVLILNSDVFEGEDKTIFSQVKEKTVSKYLFFNPSVKELFNIIFKNYSILSKYKKHIEETFEEMGIVNARIYLQVLDNIQEWVSKNSSTIGDGDILRYFILVNTNFILTHHIFRAELITIDQNATKNIFSNNQQSVPPSYQEHTKVIVKDDGLAYDKIDKYVRNITQENQYNKHFFDNLIQEIKDTSNKSGKQDDGESLVEFAKSHQSFVKSLHFMYTFKLDRYGKSHNSAEVEILNNISNFIETGIITKL
jgi:hypothetical protein